MNSGNSASSKVKAPFDVRKHKLYKVDDQNVPNMQIVTFNGQNALFIPFSALEVMPVKKENGTDKSSETSSLVFKCPSGQKFTVIPDIKTVPILQNVPYVVEKRQIQDEVTNLSVKLEPSENRNFTENVSSTLCHSSICEFNNTDIVDEIPTPNIQEMSCVAQFNNSDNTFIKQEPEVAVGQYVQKDPNDPNRWQVIPYFSDIFNDENEPVYGSPDSLTTEDEQEETTFTSETNEEPKKKKEKCACANCLEGERHSDMYREHVCHLCNKVYRKSYNLRAHLRWHNGENPYACSWLFCGKRFYRMDELKRHQLTHTTEKNFVCKLCQKRFRRPDHLNRHMNRHRQDRSKPRNTVHNKR